jgi:hypothetical protein
LSDCPLTSAALTGAVTTGLLAAAGRAAGMGARLFCASVAVASTDPAVKAAEAKVLAAGRDRRRAYISQPRVGTREGCAPNASQSRIVADEERAQSGPFLSQPSV